MIGILQANLNRNKTANDISYVSFNERERGRPTVTEWTDTKQKVFDMVPGSLVIAAVWIPDSCQISMEEHGLDRRFILVTVG